MSIIRPLLIAALVLLFATIVWRAAKPTEQRIKIYDSVGACQAEQPADDCTKAFSAAEKAGLPPVSWH